MHEIFFTYPAILARYRAEPLLAERERFLHQCAEHGYTRSGPQKIAWMLCTIARALSSSSAVCVALSLPGWRRRFTGESAP